MRTRVTDLFIYKWRYPLGYILITALLIITMAVAAVSTPGGLRAGEMDATVKSASLSVEVMEPSMVINLPYHILQRIGFILFGVSTFTIKLPSIILGLLTVIGIFFLIRVWFRRNVATLTTILVATSTQFLFLIQDGTAGIMFSFVTVWTLLAGTFISRKFMFDTFWKVVVGALLAMALYIPLGIYLVITVIVTAALHPHIRYSFKHIPRLRLILAASLGAASITPLIYACIVNPTTLFTLLGVNLGASFSFMDHAMAMWLAFCDFLTPPTGFVLTPLYSLGVVVLMTIGLYQVWRQRHTARSYFVLILGIGLMPFLFLDPSQVATVFPLATLLMAYGISILITNWYRLFPRNPYARIGGLIPLTIIVLGLVYSGVIRYTHSYTYNPQVLSHYTSDLRLLDATLYKVGSGTSITLVTSQHELAFYNVVAHYDKRFDATAEATPPTASMHIWTRAAQSGKKIDTTLTTIVTDGRAIAGDRFYIYKTPQK